MMGAHGVEDGKIPKSDQPQKRLATLQTLKDHLLPFTAGVRRRRQLEPRQQIMQSHVVIVSCVLR